MRKTFNILVLAVIMISTAVSCKCTSDKQKNEIPGEPATVESMISLDRQAIYLNHANDYRWYETGIQLKDFLDEENDGAIDMVVNVFQVIEKYSDTCFDTFVYKYQHFADGTVKEDSIHGFWVEDYPLNEEAIKVTFKEAYEKVMAVNLPKPHTRQVVLRKQVGPVDANPQWIFGNLHSQIYVDAVTGEISNENPAFRGLNLGTPLGEWP
jgi:hypothetical protein